MLDYTRLHCQKTALAFYVTNLLHSQLDTLNYENLRHYKTRTVEDYLI